MPALIHPQILEAWERTFEPQDRRPLSLWAKDNIILAPPLTITGPLDVSTSEHLRAPMDAIWNDRVREVNVMAPPRGGKTLTAEALLVSAVARDPGDFMWLFQSDLIGKQHARSRAIPILENCPASAKHFSSGQWDKKQTEIHFANGMTFYIHGHSEGRVQSKGIRYLVCDEVWLYKEGMLAEAKGRLGDFVKLGIHKLLCLSQGGEDDSDWDYQFRTGELNEWFIQCQHCGEYMLPKWSGRKRDGSRWGMVFEEHKDKNGMWVPELVAPSLRFRCMHCAQDHQWSNDLRNAWNRSGQYRIIGPAKEENKSFHWTALIDWPWAELLKIFLGARNAAKLGNYTPTVQFFQKAMAESKSESSVALESQNFELQPEANLEWPEELRRFMTIDKQAEDAYWVDVRAWAGTAESRRLFFKRVFGSAEIEEIRERFKVAPNHTLIDSGWLPKGDRGVYLMCVRYGWIALKGEDDFFFWHSVRDRKTGLVRRVMKSYATLAEGDPEAGKAMQGKGGKAKLIRFSHPTMSDRLQGLIDKGYWKEPPPDEDDPADVEYRSQMSAMVRRRHKDKRTGKETMEWHQAKRDDHAWDCNKMQVLAAILSAILPDTIDMDAPTESGKA